jgi:fatty acid amide hydrolase
MSQTPLTIPAAPTRSAAEIASRIRTGEVSAREILQAHIDRIREVDRVLNAVVVPRFEQALAEADAADAARGRGEPLGPLHGVPVTIKDQFDVAGMPTTFGLSRLKDHVAAADGPMVTALRQAGAIVLGKTNVPQTLGAHETDNALFGRTRNPWDPGRTRAEAAAARPRSSRRAAHRWGSGAISAAACAFRPPGAELRP